MAITTTALEPYCEDHMARKAWIPGIGYTDRVLNYKGAGIHERIARVAYARNGNADKPTLYKEWDVYPRLYRIPGELVVRCKTLKEAKRFIDTGE